MAQINVFFSSYRPPEQGVNYKTRLRYSVIVVAGMHTDSLDFFTIAASTRAAYSTTRQRPGHDNFIGMYGMRTGTKHSEALQVLHNGRRDYSTPSTLLLHSTPRDILVEVLRSLTDTPHSMTSVSIETLLETSVNTLSTMTRTDDKGCWLDNSGPNRLHIQAWTEREAGEDSIPIIYDE